jgi:hypothetical protein
MSLITIALFLLSILAIIGAMCVVMFVADHFKNKKTDTPAVTETQPNQAVTQEREVGRFLFKLRRSAVMKHGRAPKRLDSEYDNRN